MGTGDIDDFQSCPLVSDSSDRRGLFTDRLVQLRSVRQMEFQAGQSGQSGILHRMTAGAKRKFAKLNGKYTVVR